MITAVEQRKLRLAQQTERELAEKVNLATVEQLKHTFAKDMAVLKGRVPNQAQIAKEASLDKKYLADRQKSLALKIYPGKRPKPCGGVGLIMYNNVIDDDDDDDDDDDYDGDDNVRDDDDDGDVEDAEAQDDHVEDDEVEDDDVVDDNVEEDDNYDYKKMKWRIKGRG